MPESRQEQQDLIQEPPLEYGCSAWRSSSQPQSRDIETFTVRRLDGSLVSIRNPMFKVQKPIWKPRVKFQEYWQLVASKPDGSPETYHCTYLIDWVNEAERDYLGLLENARSLFDGKQEQWDASITCQAFKSQFRQIFDGGGKTRKRIQNEALPKDQQQLETSEVEGAFVHHALALTMASVARSYADSEGSGVRLLTQDPGYCNKTRQIIGDLGFEVVGTYGVGGFTEIDGESIAFSAYAKAPVKQMIADLACPVAIICAGNTTGGVWNARGKPWAARNLLGQENYGRDMRDGSFRSPLIIAKYEVR
ncbi:hypothetical protein BKA65DRAFT_602361 [Rhexocercosporidium sp. MPI-PUGE-AT-0058]|nr:hypothetical protein BKA65DRAFT_602361 [Rhexocercosporidium sp. MPI-PUGE-AT-0058]